MIPDIKGCTGEVKRTPLCLLPQLTIYIYSDNVIGKRGSQMERITSHSLVKIMIIGAVPSFQNRSCPHPVLPAEGIIFAVNANIAAFREGGEWLDELREYLFENRRAAEEYLSRNAAKLKPVSADATYLMWVDISEYSSDSEAFAKELREKTGLFVNGGAEYGAPGTSFIRINLATTRENVLLGMKLLSDFVSSLKQ